MKRQSGDKPDQSNLIADQVTVHVEGSTVHVHAILEDGREVCMALQPHVAQALANNIREKAEQAAEAVTCHCKH